MILQDVRVKTNISYEICYDKSFILYLHTVGTGKNASGVTNMSGSVTSLLEFDSTERRKIQQHHHHPEILRFCLSFAIILLRNAA